MMIALLLTLAAVSYAEGQQAAANHEVPAGTRTVEPLAGDFPVGRWECWFEPQAHADIAASATGYRAAALPREPARERIRNGATARRLRQPVRARGGDPLVPGAGARLEKLLRRHGYRLPRDTAHERTRNEKWAVHRLGADAMRMMDNHYGTRRLRCRACDAPVPRLRSRQQRQGAARGARVRAAAIIAIEKG